MWAPLLWFLVNPAATGMDVADPVALTFTVSAELPVSTSSIIPPVNEAPPDATGIAVVVPAVIVPLVVPVGDWVLNVRDREVQRHQLGLGLLAHRPRSWLRSVVPAGALGPVLREPGHHRLSAAYMGSPRPAQGRPGPGL